MAKYTEFYEEIRALRSKGLTYHAINGKLGLNIPKSSFTYICHDIVLSPKQIAHIRDEQLAQLADRRRLAILKNRAIFDQRIESYRQKNQTFGDFIKSRKAKLLALTMLYLGEGSKWTSHRGLQLGSANPTIIRLYIALLRDCYGITHEHLKCRVQHRADQDSTALVKYWAALTGVNPSNFYASYIDKRTIGHKTKTKDYRGVCVVSCAGTQIQLELAQIADIIVEAV